MKGELTIFLILFFSSLSLHSQISEIKGEGIIRITFRDWPYFPVEGDWPSMDVLGDIQQYVINVYSEDFIRSKFRAYESLIKSGIRPEVVVSTISPNLGEITTNEARILFTPETHESAINYFIKGGGLRFIITSPRPPYFDVPVPPGKYFLAYAVGFPRTRIDMFRSVCPLYSDKSSAVDVSKRWGPPSIYVAKNQIATIEFAPSPNCWGKLEMGDFEWERTTIFWTYIDFLNWAGEIF
jgi:hypothetical protein